jgi:hypothetical protein
VSAVRTVERPRRQFAKLEVVGWIRPPRARRDAADSGALIADEQVDVIVGRTVELHHYTISRATSAPPSDPAACSVSA